MVLDVALKQQQYLLKISIRAYNNGSVDIVATPQNLKGLLSSAPAAWRLGRRLQAQTGVARPNNNNNGFRGLFCCPHPLRFFRVPRTARVVGHFDY